MKHPFVAQFLAASALIGMQLLVACEKQQPTAPKAPAAPQAHAGGGDHDHDHDHDHAKGHDDGPMIELGTIAIGPFSVMATRDQGTIVAGKDAAIDVTVAPSAGATAKAVGVRFWIGTEDGKGSVKAKAEIEDPKEPNRWHTHAEIPNPIPSGSKLWVEIESAKGETVKGSFDLKQ